jgi:hypothetical protein
MKSYSSHQKKSRAIVLMKSNEKQWRAIAQIKRMKSNNSNKEQWRAIAQIKSNEKL